METGNKRDEELVSMAKSGDRGAFEMLYERYKNRVYGFSLRMLRVRADAEEVVAETFLSVFENINRFDESMSFPSWLFTIARNKCLDTIRKRKKFVLFSMFSSNKEGKGIEEKIAGENKRADENIDEAEIAEMVRAALAILPFEQRTAIVLREYEGMSYKEIADAMDCSINKVKILLFRAREALSKHLGPVLKEMGI